MTTQITCPITMNIISDPVTCPDGHTYERKALEEWVRISGKSPLNPSIDLSLDQIVTNYAVASLILTPDLNPEQNGQTDKVTYIKPILHTMSKNEITTLTIINPVEGNRLPRDIVFLVDNSGSMKVDATIQTSGDIPTENHGLSVWDITTHSVITSLYTMSSNDRASIVLFSNTATIMTPLQPMTEQIRNAAVSSLKKKTPDGGTNIHISIKTALFILDSREDKSREPTILLFTDGQPNERPPMGELIEFERYVKNNEGMCPTLHTFGFGNNLMSDLLYDLAVAGKGSYNFIPDSSFLGTIFVNALANIFSSYTSSGSVTCGSKTYEIGPMQYGQERWIVSTSVPTQLPFMTFTQQSNLITVTASESRTDVVNDEDIISRNLYIDTLKKCIKFCNNKEFVSANNLIDSCKGHIRKTEYGNALLADLEGEVTKAISKTYFFKWGKHWLFSILRAHELQICNNFLDPGVQLYGGKLYRELVEKANDIFNLLPPPEPSIKKENTVQCYSMSYYNNPSSGSCFSGENLVEMANGQLKKVESIEKGDKVHTQYGEARVVCVLKTKCNNDEADLVQIFNKKSPTILRVTPYHPILWKDSWIHPTSLPISVSRRSIQPCKAVYSFLLDDDHTMIINNTVVISLAHGRKTDAILEHWFYGTREVVKFMMACPGWDEGLVIIDINSTMRDENGIFLGLKI